ncbi:MAG: hypothetical protein WCZ10_10100 [Desulfobulbaceae bacterium]
MAISSERGQKQDQLFCLWWSTAGVQGFSRRRLQLKVSIGEKAIFNSLFSM